MFLTIQPSLLTGAILVLFLENKHLENEMTARFYDRIKPFYHKLTLFSKLVQQFDFAFKYNNEVDNEMCKSTKRTIKSLSRLAGRCIISGSDIGVMTAGELDRLCNDINNVWYTNDRYNSDFHSFVNWADSTLCFHLKQIKEALKAYDFKYSDKTINVDLFPDIAGDFYVEEWQPVQDVTSSYEYWSGKCAFFHRLSLSYIVYIIASLMIYILFPELHDSMFFLYILGISLYLFFWCLYDIYRLMELSKRLIR